MNKASANSINTELFTFIAEELLFDRDADELSGLDSDSRLLEEGYLDSMGIFRLIDFIEREYGVALQPSEIQVEYFQSINTIKKLIERQRQPQ